MRLKGVELGDRDEPEVVMKRQATGKKQQKKTPKFFQFHLPSSFLHSTPLKHGTLYIKIMMQLYQKAHTLYMNYQSIHFFSFVSVSLFVYISILIGGPKMIVVFIFSLIYYHGK